VGAWLRRLEQCEEEEIFRLIARGLGLGRMQQDEEDGDGFESYNDRRNVADYADLL
jgi:hypothetical protein